MFAAHPDLFGWVLEIEFKSSCFHGKHFSVSPPYLPFKNAYLISYFLCVFVGDFTLL